MTWMKGTNTSSADSVMTENWDNWLISQRAVLTFIKTWTGWRAGQRNLMKFDKELRNNPLHQYRLEAKPLASRSVEKDLWVLVDNGFHEPAVSPCDQESQRGVKTACFPSNELSVYSPKQVEVFLRARDPQIFARDKDIHDKDYEVQNLTVIDERKKPENFYFKGLSFTCILEKMRSDLGKVKDHICSVQLIKDQGHIDSMKEIQFLSLPFDSIA
ncbi:hypothetical protein DUI87_18652 [Hirundo rustica rustica]|uniref:Uncharacterized protein n=1 Tax=Hirundo rustica rustica TaxID=333673 RepID=A0A3M0JX52_HIRRU|nr:hypothetical protein DUI87_18652 [Hirundo rustica rustica]